MHGSGEVMCIPEFYSGRSIFITGATGFMGKVLLEKLLRSCPQISKIYILVRPKKGQDVQTRVTGMLESKLFDELRKTNTDVKSKVVAVKGDILDPGLGLSDTDCNMLLSNVSVVFHSAATVKFDDPLKFSVQMNVLGVRKVLELCHQMARLEALIHVSTAYCNCDKDVIRETIYPPPVQPHKIIDATEWMEDDILDALTPLILKPRPNTYTYTKALAECILLKERGAIPCAVVRPSIVGASNSEPIPGWVDSFSGSTVILVASGKGVLRVMKGNSDGTSDIIPVDIAINLMIASAWSLAIERPSHIPVYNCTTGDLNRVTWGQLVRIMYKCFMKTPLLDPVRVPDPKLTSSNLYRNIHVWLDHYLPALLIDSLLWIQGKKPRMLKVQNEIWKSMDTLEYFTSNQWVFTNQNVTELFQKLYAEDQQMFNFDVTQINWQHYMENYCLGVKEFLLKDDMRTVDVAKKSLKRLIIIRRVFYVVAIFIFVLVWLANYGTTLSL